MATVMSVPRSVAFYSELGFSLGNTFAPSGADEPAWAWLVCGDVHLMVTTNGESFSIDRRSVLFYLYVDDVKTTHAELEAKGMQVGTITTPFYAPRGEFEVIDPDGYLLMISHV